jgi:hypothetical protein
MRSCFLKVYHSLPNPLQIFEYKQTKYVTYFMHCDFVFGMPRPSKVNSNLDDSK